MKKNPLKYLVAGLMICLSFQSCLKDDQTIVGIPNPTITVELLRLVHKGSDVELNKENLDGAKQVGGVVISDPTSKNLPDDFIVIQSSGRRITRGIIIKASTQIAAGFKIGDSIIVNLEGKKITRSSGPLMITGINQNDIKTININQIPQTRSVAIGALLSRFDDYESTLISIPANIEPAQVGSKLAGSKTLDDGSGKELTLYTNPAALFADVSVPANASFTGIPYRESADVLQLRLRKESDLSNPSGPMYAGWPESFESPDLTVKGSYNMPAIDNMAALQTGQWWLYYSILANTAGRDIIVTGEQSIRIQQDLGFNAYLQMNFDVPNGASKVTVWYSSYYNDASSTFSLEASTDQGATWKEIGQPITNAAPFSSGPKLASFLMDIKEPVRFRINKHGLGPTLVPVNYNGRLAIDDFAIYESY